MSVTSIPTGLIVTAEQKPYPMELSSSEIYIHLSSLNEYKVQFITDMIKKSEHCKPDTSLINQQPHMSPQRTRYNMVTFMFQLSTVTNVTDGVFANAVRLYDRYCSKRIVLSEQSKLVAATCLWLSAKSMGGCDHIINDHVVPTGGRFHGPTPRARIPRINELIYYCGGKKCLNKSMFLQMERHILQTLNWEIVRPSLSDMILNIDENCLLQYEWYKHVLLSNKNQYRKELYQIDNKIEIIDIKMFLIDLVAWQYSLLNYDMVEVSNSIFRILKRFLMQDCPSFIMEENDFVCELSNESKIKIDHILINAICTAPTCLLNKYPKSAYIRSFCKKVNQYKIESNSRRTSPKLHLCNSSTSMVNEDLRTAMAVMQKPINLQKIQSSNLSNYPSPISVDYATFSDIKLDDETSNDETSNDEDDDGAIDDIASPSIGDSFSQSVTSVFSDHGDDCNNLSTPASPDISFRRIPKDSSPLATKSRMTRTLNNKTYINSSHLQSKLSLYTTNHAIL